MPGLGRAPHILSLPVADIVHQHGLGAGGAAQLLIAAGLDAEHAAIVGQAIGEEGVFSFQRTVIAPQIAQHVPGRGLAGIDADGLHLKVDAGDAAALLLEERDLGRGETGQDRVGQGQACLIVPFEVGDVQGEGLAQFPAHLGHHVAGHQPAGLHAEPFPLLGREGKALALLLFQPAFERFLLEVDALPGLGLGAGQFPGARRH